MEKITRQFCFHHPGGEDIYLFTLRNTNGVSVSITNYGAIITSLLVPSRDGQITDIVLGLEKVEDYLSPSYLSAYPYFGAVVGRYGNRIKDGVFTLDGKIFQLEKNNGSDHLHGGPGGFDKKAWSVVDYGVQPNARLLLRYISADGEEGYPGELTTLLEFTLTDDNELTYRFTATTLQPTIVNLTHHSYFNLNDGNNDISGHYMHIPADYILEQGPNYTPTGKLLAVDNTEYDFRTPAMIREKWIPSKGYDQSFVNKKNNLQEPVASTWSSETGIRLDVLTTEPVVHLYTGGGISAIKGKNNKTYGPYSGLCLETQVHPNAINIPDFPNTVLRPGETYKSSTVYRLGTAPEK